MREFSCGGWKYIIPPLVVSLLDERGIEWELVRAVACNPEGIEYTARKRRLRHLRYMDGQRIIATIKETLEQKKRYIVAVAATDEV